MSHRERYSGSQVALVPPGPVCHDGGERFAAPVITVGLTPWSPVDYLSCSGRARYRCGRVGDACIRNSTGHCAETSYQLPGVEVLCFLVICSTSAWRRR